MKPIATSHNTREFFPHALPLSDILDKFHVDPKNGLSSAGILLRQKECGLNALPRGIKKGPLRLFLGQFANPLVIILLISAALTFYIKDYADSTVIILAVLVNVTIGFWQEYRSNKIFEKLDAVIEVMARVRRNGKIVEVNMKELVPGDIIMVYADMKVPADARILYTDGISANEALLTGESSSIGKKDGLLPADTALGDRKNMLHMGTIVEAGAGEAIVVKTGEETEIGAIAALTLGVEDEQTPLQGRLAGLSKIMSVFVAVCAAIIFLVGFLEGQSIVEIFKLAVAVSVAAIPEGLPAALSVVLAVSATRILKKKGLVKKLIGAETLGSTSVILTDKTGTLTTGIMKTEHLILSKDDDACARALALASNVSFIDGASGTREFRGESTDKAKVEFFTGRGGNYDELTQEYNHVAFLPFNEEKKYIASFRQKGNGHGVIFVTGAPETLLDMSKLTEKEKAKILEAVEKEAAVGFRMIAVAEGNAPDASVWKGKDAETLATSIHNLKFLGVAALRDPIRKDVPEAIRVARGAGVHVSMATGDHRLTALSIGRELGFRASDENIVTGKELDALSDDELKEKIKDIEIFARVTPSHKMRIIKIFKDRGEVVAMTGDGINDAPALRASDIGVALGSGTDVTKETADLVLVDDSFSVITAAIREGRIAFANIRKVVVFLLCNSFTEIIIVLSALILRTDFFPVTAVLILWANLVEDTFPNFALAFEPGEKNVMEKPPIGGNESILDRQGIAVVTINILSDAILVAMFWYLYNYTSYTPEHIQTLIFAIFATGSLFIVFAVKSHDQSMFRTNAFDNRYLLFAVFISLMLMAVALYVPTLQRFLGTVPLSFKEVLFVAGLIALRMASIEFMKWLFRLRERKTAVGILSPRPV